MKTIMYTAALLSLLAMGSCGKIKGREATVIRNCTGTYLRLDGKDYRVCNRSATNDYADGSMVSVSYYPVSACTEKEEGFVCHMVYPCEGLIRVTSIGLE